ncbi:unnamed protein product [Owenia fusiformis]|uniref:Hexosyltransferase n=1 Tax=Owenia fusiformis TaxID=6347 RepID=A0A8J1TYS2_OWEFU|nr:unnamed protein product [Owenia fusiformis]
MSYREATAHFKMHKKLWKAFLFIVAIFATLRILENFVYSESNTETKMNRTKSSQLDHMGHDTKYGHLTGQETNPVTEKLDTCEDVIKQKNLLKIHPRTNKTRTPKEYYDLSWNNSKLMSAEFILNPKQICVGEVDALVMVLSGTKDAHRRYAVRKTIGGAGKFVDKKIVLVFLMGLTDDPSIQIKINGEMRGRKDIIQANFMDTYENLTIKTHLSLKWAMEFCPHAKYHLHATDDVMFNPYKLFTTLKDLPKEGLYYGCSMPNPVIERRSNIYYHIRSDVKWSGWFYPPMHYGFFFVITQDVVANFYKLSCMTPLTFPDDAQIAAWVEMLNIPVMGKEELCIHWIVVSNEEKMMQLFAHKEHKNMFVHFGSGPETGRKMLRMWKYFEKYYKLTYMPT